MVPERVHSFINSMVIKNPLRTKKTLTEMTPPSAQANPPWLAMMPRMDTARMPSRAGMYFSWGPTPEGPPPFSWSLMNSPVVTGARRYCKFKMHIIRRPTVLTDGAAVLPGADGLGRHLHLAFRP
jgi:hypothetical protein